MRDTLILTSLVCDTSLIFLDWWPRLAFWFTPQTSYRQSAWQFTSVSVSHVHTNPQNWATSFKHCYVLLPLDCCLSKPKVSEAEGARWPLGMEEESITISNMFTCLIYFYLCVFYNANSFLLNKDVIIIYKYTNVAGVSKTLIDRITMSGMFEENAQISQ